MAKVDPQVKALGPFCVEQVRRCGGVLEHPAGSALFKHCGLPWPGSSPDEFGGFSVRMDQSWFGFRSRKPTWLYVVGVEPVKLTVPMVSLIPASHRCEDMGRAERSRTVPALARWLFDLAESAAR